MIDKALTFIEEQANLYFQGLLGTSTEKYVAMGNIAKYAENELNLSEDDQAALVDLLGEKSMIAMSTRMKQYANRDDEEARAQTDAEKEKAEAEVDDKIADLLGDSFGQYADYSEKRNEYDYAMRLNRD